MKKLWTTLCVLALSLLCVVLLPTQANAASGTCGDNLTWELDDEETLTISGTGAMADYSDFDDYPWYSSIEAVVIGDKVTSIGGSAFKYCSRLTSVTIGNSVTTIGSYAFEDCSRLTSITIPDSVTTIGEDAFSGCSSLTDLYFGGTIAQWCGLVGNTYIEDFTVHATDGSYRFYGTCGDNLTWVLDDEGTLTISGTGAMADYSILATNLSPWYSYRSSIEAVVIGDKVTTIGSYAFADCDNLTSVTIGNSVTTIGGGAFEYCSSLTSVTIPDSVTTIGNYAFENCDSLASVTIPDSVTTIGSYAFYGCDSLTSITIPNSVTTIGEYAFYSCDSLTSVTIPDSVTSIGSSAFAYCDNLASITIPDSVTTIGSSAFSGCSSLTDLYFGGTIAQWCKLVGNDYINDFTVHATDGNYRFYGICGDNLAWALDNKGTLTISGTGAMADYYDSPWDSYRSSIKAVVIGDKVTTVGSYAFYDCDNLARVAIGNSVTTIGNYAFDSCDSLTSITIPDSVTTIGEEAFYDCDSLASVTIGNSVTTIGNYAFEYCSRLTSVTIGNSVTTIGNSAFAYCASLTSITLGNSVTSIGSAAFAYCDSLASVTIGNSVAAIDAYAFAYCDNLSKVYYCGTKEQKANIIIADQNSPLVNAQWYYNYIPGAKYTVTFKNWNGKVISKTTYSMYDKVIAPTKPTRPADSTYIYTFKGWNKTVATSCTADATYTATYTAKLRFAPTGVKVTNNATSGKPVVTWTASKGAAKYEIYRSVNGSAFKLLTTTAKKTYTDTAAKAGTVYRYRIRAVSSNAAVGKSDLSAIVKCTAKLPTPTLTVTYQQAGSRNVIKWTKSAGATKYVLQVSINGGAYKTLTTTTKLTYTHQKLVGGNTYRYRVIAKTETAQSAYSAVKTVTAKCVAPAIKVALVAKKPVITWNAVSGAKKYEVFVSTSKNGTYKRLKTVTAKKLTHSAAVKGKTYFYKVRAIDAKGVAGAFSAIKSIRVK